MGKEKCWRCTKLHIDVDLQSTDDPLCEPCFWNNEAELAIVRRRDTERQNVTTLSFGQAFIDSRDNAGPATALDRVGDEANVAGLLLALSSTVRYASIEPASSITTTLSAPSTFVLVAPNKNYQFTSCQQTYKELTVALTSSCRLVPDRTKHYINYLLNSIRSLVPWNSAGCWRSVELFLCYFAINSNGRTKWLQLYVIRRLSILHTW